jgi:BCCT family betaine/carnitine transporter
MSDTSTVSVDRGVFVPALVVIVATCVLLGGLVVGGHEEAGAQVINTMREHTTGELGWIYLWFAVGALGVLCFCVVTRYGSVKFGGPDEKPEFSTMSWIGMLFCAGVGSSLLYWGCIEWAVYYASPPTVENMAPMSPRAAEWAATYGPFHWGIVGWAIYCLPTLPIAYAIFNRKKHVLRLSEACRGVLGRTVDGPVGKVIDVFFIFGLVGGVGTTLGLGTPLIAEMLHNMFGVAKGLQLEVGIILVWAAMFSTSVFLGLKKGIKVFSNINVYLALGIAGFFLIFGPTSFILNTFTHSMGLMLNNFFSMCLSTSPVVGPETGNTFPQSWTIFYWAWWVAYAPFMGLFVARISRGRTVRELVIAELLAGSAGCWLFFAVIGNTSMHMELTGTANIVQTLNDAGAPAAIVKTVTSMPLGGLLLFMYMILAMIFLTTLLDSAAYTVAATASKIVDKNHEPARWHRVLWAILLAAVPLALLGFGALDILKTLSIVAALPVVPILIITTVSFFKWVREDSPEIMSSSVTSRERGRQQQLAGEETDNGH